MAAQAGTPTALLHAFWQSIKALALVLMFASVLFDSVDPRDLPHKVPLKSLAVH